MHVAPRERIPTAPERADDSKRRLLVAEHEVVGLRRDAILADEHLLRRRARVELQIETDASRGGRAEVESVDVTLGRELERDFAARPAMDVIAELGASGFDLADRTLDAFDAAAELVEFLGGRRGHLP